MRETPPARPNTERRVYEFRLPSSDTAAVLHAKLADIPGFRGITTRDDIAHATFLDAPPLGVAREIVRRLVALEPAPDKKDQR